MAFIITAKMVVLPPSAANMAAVNAAMRRGVAGIGGAAGGAAAGATVAGGARGVTNTAAVAGAVAATGATTRLATANTQLGSSYKNTSRFMSTTVRDIATLTGGMLTLHGAILGVIAGLKAFVEYEKQMGAMAQITRKTIGEVQELGIQVRQLSIQYGVSSSILNKNTIELLQAGRSIAQVRQALPTLALLGTNAQVGADGLAEATKAMIVWQEVFGLTQAQTRQSFEKTVKLAKQQFISVSELIEGTTILAATAKSSGSSFEEMISIIASTKTRAGRPVTEVSRALNTLLSRVVSPQHSKKLEKQFGIEVFDKTGTFKGPLAILKEIKAVRDSFGEASKEAITLDLILGGIRRRSLAGSALESIDDAAKNLASISGSVNELEEDFSRVENTIGVKLSQTLAMIKDSFIAIAEEGEMRTLLVGVLALVRGLTMLTDVAKILLPILTLLGLVKLTSILGPLAAAGILGTTTGAHAKGNIAGTLGARVKNAPRSILNALFNRKQTHLPPVPSAFQPSATSVSGFGHPGAAVPPRSRGTAIGPVIPGGGSRVVGATVVSNAQRRAAAQATATQTIPRRVLPGLSRGSALGLALIAGAASGFVKELDLGSRVLKSSLEGATLGLILFTVGMKGITGILAGLALTIFRFLQLQKEARIKARTTIFESASDIISTNVSAAEQLKPEQRPKFLKTTFENQAIRVQQQLGPLQQRLHEARLGEGLGGPTLDPSLGPFTPEYAKGIGKVQELSQQFITSVVKKGAIKRRSQELKEALSSAQKNNLGALEQQRDFILEQNKNIDSMEDFEAAGGGFGKVIRDFMLGLGTAGFILDGTTQKILNQRLANKRLANSSEEVTTALDTQLLIMGQSIKNTTGIIREIVDRAGSRKGFSGKEQAISDYGQRGFAETVSTLPTSKGVRNKLLQFNTAIDNMIKVVSEAPKRVDPTSLVANLISVVPSEMGNEIRKRFAKVDTTDEDSLADFLKELANTAEFGKDVVETVSKGLLRFAQDLIAAVGQGVETVARGFGEATDQFIKVIGKQAEAQRAVLEAINLETELRTGRPARGGGVNVLARRQATSLAGTADVGKIGQTIRDLQHGLSIDANILDRARLEAVLTRNVAALNVLADSTSRLTGIQDDLARAQSGLASKFGLAEEFIGGDQETRVQMIRDAMAAQTAVQRGTFAGLSEEVVKGALSHLGRVGDIEGAAGLSPRGFTGEELKQSLIRSTVGGQFFAPELGAQRQAEEQTIQVMRDAANAQIELAKAEESILNTFVRDLERLFERFLNEQRIARTEREEPVARIRPGDDAVERVAANVRRKLGLKQAGIEPTNIEQAERDIKKEFGGPLQFPRIQQGGIDVGAHQALLPLGGQPLRGAGQAQDMRGVGQAQDMRGVGQAQGVRGGAALPPLLGGGGPGNILDFPGISQQSASGAAGTKLNRFGQPILTQEGIRARKSGAFQADRTQRQQQQSFRQFTRQQLDATNGNTTQQAITEEFNRQHSDKQEFINFNRLRQSGFTDKDSANQLAFNRLNRQREQDGKQGEPTMKEFNRALVAVMENLRNLGNAPKLQRDINDRRQQLQPQIVPQPQQQQQQQVLKGGFVELVNAAQEKISANFQGAAAKIDNSIQTVDKQIKEFNGTVLLLLDASGFMKDAAETITDAFINGEIKVNMDQKVDVNINDENPWEGAGKQLADQFEEMSKKTIKEVITKWGTNAGIPTF